METLRARIPLLRERMRECTLCPRECRVDRLGGRTGFCGLGAGAVLARALPHFGEEPPMPVLWGVYGRTSHDFASMSPPFGECINISV